jgi:hypothetical protein
MAVRVRSAVLCLSLVAVGACSSPRSIEPAATAIPTAAASPRATTVPTPQPATAAPAATPASVEFRSSAERLNAQLRERVTGSSWRQGCPVGLDDLRYLRMSTWDPGGAVRSGEMIVHADAVDAILSAFSRLFAARYPITKMRLVDDYGGDDVRSMTDDNTSAFNCRPVQGTSRWSQHAYGRAVDVNPFENPWVKDGKTDPPAAARFADRSQRHPAMIRHGDAVWRAFAGVGWEWGGDWNAPKDYQHFSASGR